MAKSQGSLQKHTQNSNEIEGIRLVARVHIREYRICWTRTLGVSHMVFSPVGVFEVKHVQCTKVSIEEVGKK